MTPSQSAKRSLQDKNVRTFFSAFAQQWDSLYGSKRSRLWRIFDHAFRRDVYERYHLTFDRIGAELSGKTVVDIGCASGVYCFEAARRGAARVVGLDVSPEMIALAQSNSRDGGWDRVCDFITTGFPPPDPHAAISRPFDYAIVMGVMDYVLDTDSFLRALRPMVVRRAVLSFPGKHWLRGPLRQHRYRALKRCDIHNYDEAEIRDACSNAGFSRVSIQRLNHSGICYIVTVEP